MLGQTHDNLLLLQQFAHFRAAFIVGLLAKQLPNCLERRGREDIREYLGMVFVKVLANWLQLGEDLLPSPQFEDFNLSLQAPPPHTSLDAILSNAKVTDERRKQGHAAQGAFDKTAGLRLVGRSAHSVHRFARFCRSHNRSQEPGFGHFCSRKKRQSFVPVLTISV